MLESTELADFLPAQGRSCPSISSTPPKQTKPTTKTSKRLPVEEALEEAADRSGAPQPGQASTPDATRVPHLVQNMTLIERNQSHARFPDAWVAMLFCRECACRVFMPAPFNRSAILSSTGMRSVLITWLSSPHEQIVPRSCHVYQAHVHKVALKINFSAHPLRQQMQPKNIQQMLTDFSRMTANLIKCISIGC
jgi:hypothetical protein